jgi:hypothetical protein
VDRLVAFCSLVAFAKVQQSNRGYAKRIETKEKLENSQKFSKLNWGAFRHIGRSHSNKNTMATPSRRAFKNIR